MIHEINARNVHNMFPKALRYMLENAEGEPSRNGTVISLQKPCMLTYGKPLERVIFHPERNANPFFHFMESLWMLSGRQDVELPAKYVSTMTKYSDDGVTLNGAYGYRWRKWFGSDQLAEAVQLLKDDPTTRRVVILMWATSDLGKDSKDIPCNLMVIPRIVHGKLDITVVNRSNDIVWGAMGANAVHFSFLQEFLAIAIGVPVGTYYQFSTNMHLYPEEHARLAESASEMRSTSPYETEGFEPVPIMSTDVEHWLKDLNVLLDHGATGIIGLKDPFFRKVAIPLMIAWEQYSQGEISAAIRSCYEISDLAWRAACVEWIKRKTIRNARAQDDGVNYE